MVIKELILEKLRENPDKAKVLYELFAEKAKRENENLLKKYVPNKKCDEFIKLVGSNKNFVNVFCAANGVGKSCVGANIVSNICFGVQNNYFKHPLFEKFPYLKKGRIISDPTTIKQKIIPELKKWFPSNRYNIHYNTSKEGKQYDSKWTTDTGFEFDLMTTEQSTKEFESVDIGWCWIDEPCPKDIYLATIARARLGMILFWTLTPLSYSAWIKDDIIDRSDGNSIDYVEADVWANCKDIEGTNGILSKENIDRMIGQYPEDEKEARINGKFGHLLGRVHKLFDRKIHVIKPFSIDYKNYTVYCALDTHPRIEDAYSIMAINDKGTKYIIDELWINGRDNDIAALIKQKEHGLRIKKRLIDPSAMNSDKRTEEKSYGLRLLDLGLRFELGSKDLIGGIRRTDEALRFEKKENIFIKEPELYIFDTCVRTIKEFENYVWDEYRGRTADERDSKPRPKDKNDHFIENIHRLLLEEFKFIYNIEDNTVREIFDKYSYL